MKSRGDVQKWLQRKGKDHSIAMCDMARGQIFGMPDEKSKRIPNL